MNKIQVGKTGQTQVEKTGQTQVEKTGQDRCEMMETSFTHPRVPVSGGQPGKLGQLASLASFLRVGKD